MPERCQLWPVGFLDVCFKTVITVNRGDSNTGFTLIEMLMAMAVLSVLTLAMAHFYSTFVRAARQPLAYNSVNQNLSLVMNRITTPLRSAGRNQSVRGGNPYEFVGIDGNDRGFLNSDTTPHNDLSSQPNNHSDRLHFHGFESYNGLDPDTSTGRTYVAFWINGEAAPKSHNELKNQWGVLMRKKYHENPDVLPYFPSYASGQKSPVLDLNESGTELHLATNLIGVNIDYLSFQYYDPTGNCNCGPDNWCNNWNTTDDAICPVPPENRRIPSAVKVAIRAYDPRANTSSGSGDLVVGPQWNQTTISLQVGQ